MRLDVLVPCALRFVWEIDRRWPERDRKSDGSLAGAEHSRASPHSDHEHGTSRPGDRDVDAVDIDDDGVDMGEIIAKFQRHPSAYYWIYNDVIAFRSNGWRRESYAYAGPYRNKHTKHGHFNWSESVSAHNDTTPYGIYGAREETVSINAETLLQARAVDNRPWRSDHQQTPRVRWEWAIISTWDEAHAAHVHAKAAHDKAVLALAAASRIEAALGRLELRK